MMEEVIIIFENEKIRVEEIESFGEVSPAGFWYDQNEDEWTQITRGSVILEFENFEVRLNTGENYYIYKHVKHRVKFTSPDAKWLCVFEK